MKKRSKLAKRILKERILRHVEGKKEEERK